jgi:exopolysaccharide production protein ExoQ
MISRVRWVWQILPFVFLSILALYAMAPFRSNLAIVVVLAAPLILSFVVPTAFPQAIENARALVRTFTWWHWLILFAVISGLVFRIREVQQIESNPLDASAMVRIFFAAVVAVALIVRLFRGQSMWLRALFQGLIGWLMMFAAFSLVSTFWSVKPTWSFYKSLEFSIDLALYAAIVLYALAVDNYEPVLNWVYTLMGLIILSAWIGALIDPADGFTYGETGLFLIPQLTGIFPVAAANGLGTMAAVLCLVATTRLLIPMGEASRSWYISLAAFGVITMIMTDARSAIIGFLLGLVLLLIVTRHVLAGLFLSVAGTVIVAFSNTGAVVWTYILRGQHEKEFAGLSGRLEWWQFAWQKFLERPLTGWGGFAGGRFFILPQITQPGQETVPDLHSNIIEPLVDTGLFGLLFILIALFGAWWYLYRGYRSPKLNPAEGRLAVEAMAILALLTVRCTVSSILTSHPAIPFLAILGYAEYVRRRLKYGKIPGIMG